MNTLCFLPPAALARVHRALPPPHRVRSAATWEELVDQVGHRRGDVVIVDPCSPREGDVVPRLRALAVALARAPGTPLVGYVSVTAAAIHAVQALVRLGAAEVVVRGVDDRSDALASVIRRATATSLAQRLVESLGNPFAALPCEIAAALQLLFQRPERLRCVSDLARSARTTRRSLDRWLARAGLAPASTLLSCARASSAFQLLVGGRVRTTRVAALLGYPSSRALARELRRVTGHVPSALGARVTPEAFIAAVGPRLLRAGSRSMG